MAIEHGHSAIAELLIEAGHEAVEHRHFFDPGVVPIHEDEEEEGTPVNPPRLSAAEVFGSRRL